jgi:acid phosphatase (class A)
LFASAPAAAKQAAFVSAEQAQAVSILPDPLADGSPEQQAEIAALHAIEAIRSKAQEEAARADAEDKSVFVFRTVFGDRFNADNLPLTAALAGRVDENSSVISGAAKKSFHRLHPYTFDTTLHPACKSKGEPESYPSGHALRGWLLALMLVEMVPEKRDAILSRAEDYGHNRLVCGVHYPSDVAASKPLAYAVHALMTQNADYRRELAAARAELRGALALPE